MLDLEKKYNGKLLLFGEYLVLVGAEAFALPLEAFYGRFLTNEKSQPRLPISIYEYLLAQTFAKAELEKSKLFDALTAGLAFDSTIRSGYGNGSSGALSAAIYDQFFLKTQPSLQDDRSNLIAIESFFQGKSSGIDPLVCYYDKPVHIHEDGAIDVNIGYNQNQLQKWYLFDSKSPRNTGKLVEIFKNKLQKSSYKQEIDALKEMSNRAIRLFLADKSVDDITHDISSKQWELFSEMILEVVGPYWQTGLESQKYSFKLCGAGGGGYYLVHVPNVNDVKIEYPDLWSQLIPMVDISL